MKIIFLFLLSMIGVSALVAAYPPIIRGYRHVRYDTIPFLQRTPLTELAQITLVASVLAILFLGFGWLVVNSED